MKTLTNFRRNFNLEILAVETHSLLDRINNYTAGTTSSQMALQLGAKFRVDLALEVPRESLTKKLTNAHSLCPL